MASDGQPSPHETLDERAADVSVGTLPSRSGIVAEEFDLEGSILEAAGGEKVEKLIDLALRGAMPRSRALKAWEPDKLNSRHISVIMMRAVGYRQNRIAELTGFEQSTVSIVLNHPDAQTLLSCILAESAKKSIGVAATVRKHAPKMLEIVRQVSTDIDAKPETRLKAAFGWLGMYERLEEKQQGDKPAAVPMHSDDVSRLVGAINEAKLIQGKTYAIVSEGGVVATTEVAAAPSPLAQPADTSAASDDAIESALRAADLERALEGEIARLYEAQATPSRLEVLGGGLSLSSAAVDVKHEQQVSMPDVEEKSA